MGPWEQQRYLIPLLESIRNDISKGFNQRAYDKLTKVVCTIEFNSRAEIKAEYELRKLVKKELRKGAKHHESTSSL